MKKLKNKVYPSPSPTPPSSSSSSAASSNGDFLSILNFLPVAILALVSVLSMEEREVLAYMMTRSKKTSPSFLTPSERKKKPTKKPNSGNGGNGGGGTTHAPPPVFDCDCFECYTSYWNRWNLSPNRELIHQAIDAYEDELEKSSKNSGKGKRRDKVSRRSSEKIINAPSPQPPPQLETETEVFVPEIDDVAPTTSKNIETVEESGNGEEKEKEEEGNGEIEKTVEETAVILRSPAVNSHKGLARKVLPDVLGLFNSRFWNLWGPN